MVPPGGVQHGPFHTIYGYNRGFQKSYLLAQVPISMSQKCSWTNPLQPDTVLLSLLGIGYWYPSHLVGQMVTDTLLVTLGALGAPQHIGVLPD